MHSPKFAAKSKTLTKTVNESTLAFSWRKKVRDDLRRQPIPDPVEHLDFHVDYQANCSRLAAAIKAGSYSPSQVTRLTSEKSKGLCRLVVINHPTDALILQVLADSLWSELSTVSPTKKAFFAPKDHAFSKAKKGLEDEYGPIGVWLKFQKEILGFAKQKNYIVVTDIANYFDWIRYSWLRSALSDLIGPKEIVLDCLLYVLRGMIWRPDYMSNYEIGLPQCDQDAPRMLAHTCLFEADELLDSYPDADFARYMDDIDIGVDTLARAKQILRDLDLTLQSRHLRLNSGKTKILSRSEAIYHFCVHENAILDKIETLGEFLKSKGLPLDRVRKLLIYLMHRLDRGSRFDDGNGIKILKRLIGYSGRYGVRLEKDDFARWFLRRSGVRDSLLRYVGRSINPFEYIDALSNIIETGEIVDDLTTPRIAVEICNARYTKKLPNGTLEKFISHLDEVRPFHFFAAIWLRSRFSDLKSIKSLIDNGEQSWTKERILVRVVAGMLPLFRGSPFLPAYLARVSRVGGRTAQDIFDFYDNFIMNKAQFGKVSKFLNKPNPSFKNGLSHSKFLMIYGYLSSPDFKKTEKAKLLMKHTLARQDLYYRASLNAKLKSIP